MRSNQELFERYDDLLEPGDDPSLLGVVRDLDAAYPPARRPERVAVSVLERAHPSTGAMTTERLARWLPGSRAHRSATTDAASARTIDGAPGQGYADAPPPLRRSLGMAVGASSFAAAMALIVVLLTSWLPDQERATEQQPAASRRVPPVREVGALSPEQQALLDRTFRRNRYTRVTMGRGMGEPVALAQTVGGYTVTVGRVYADPKYIIVGFVVNGPEGREHTDIKVEDLVNQFNSMGAYNGVVTFLNGRQAGKEIRVYGYNADDGRDHGYALFIETPKLGPGTERLRLKMELPAITGREIPSGKSIEEALTGVPHPEPCSERSLPVRCYLRGPYAFELSVPVVSDRPLFPSRQTEMALGRAKHNFLDERIMSMFAKNEKEARLHERRARNILTPEYSAQVPDLAALPLPNLRDEEGRAEHPGFWYTEIESVTETRATVPQRWAIGDEVVVRRFHYQIVAGRWRISRIEPLEKDPQPWLSDPYFKVD